MGLNVLIVAIWLVEENEVTMAPAFRQVAFFFNFELFLFMLKKPVIPYFNEGIV